MRNIKRAVQSNTLLRQNLIFLVGSVTVATLNYAFHPVMSRLVSVSVFGEIQFILSSFLLLAIGANVFNQLFVNVYQNSPKDKQPSVILAARRINVKASALILLIGMITFIPLGHVFNFETPAAFIVIPLSWAAGLWSNYFVGIYRSVGNFLKVSIVDVTSSLTKLVACASLAAAGFATFGIGLGFVITGVVASLVGYSLLGQHKPAEENSIKLLDQPDGRKLAQFIVLMSASSILLLSVDTIIAKARLSAEDAGLYAGIASIARILFFVSISVGMVLYSSINTSSARAEVIKKFTQSLMIFFTVTLPPLLLMVMWPETVLKIVLGDEFTAYSDSLPILALAILLASAQALAVQLLSAVRYYPAAKLNLAAIVVIVPLILAFSDTVEGLANVMLLSAGVLFAVNIFEVWKWAGKQS